MAWTEAARSRTASAELPLRATARGHHHVHGRHRACSVDRLVREFNAQVKIQYDAQRTRLHAKAWMFRRHTGFDTAYVGSSNLSTSALLDGVEWNVRLSHSTTPALLQKCEATFDSYWNGSEFEVYDPKKERDRLD